MENSVASILSKMRSGPATKNLKRKNLFLKAGCSISFEEYEEATNKKPLSKPTNGKSKKETANL